MAKRISTAAFFKRVIEAWGDEIANAGKKELQRGAEKILTQAKENCPVDTGKLRDSLHIETSRDGSDVRVVADAQNDEGVYYGRYVEFSPTTGKPFLYPAYDANIRQIRQNALRAMNQAARDRFPRTN